MNFLPRMRTARKLGSTWLPKECELLRIQIRSSHANRCHFDRSSGCVCSLQLQQQDGLSLPGLERKPEWFESSYFARSGGITISLKWKVLWFNNTSVSVTLDDCASYCGCILISIWEMHPWKENWHNSKSCFIFHLHLLTSYYWILVVGIPFSFLNLLPSPRR